MSDPLETTHGEIAQLIRVAGHIGTYLAHNQQARLREAQRASEVQQAALAAQMKDELMLGKGFYSQVEREEWWDRAKPRDIAHAYGFAKRFSAVDPEAVTAAAVIEQETRARYGIDLRASDPGEFARMANQDVAAPLLVTDAKTQTEVDDLINAARHSELKEHQEAQVTQAKPEEYSPDQTMTEHQEAVNASTYVDSLEHRQQWAQEQRKAGVSSEAVQAIATASKARSQPLSGAILASAGQSAPPPQTHLYRRRQATASRSR